MNANLVLFIESFFLLHDNLFRKKTDSLILEISFLICVNLRNLRSTSLVVAYPR